MTKQQKARAAVLADMGCAVCGSEAMIHHAKTGGGGRRDHDKLIPLCHNHHQGREGIHTLGRKRWESTYGTENSFLERFASVTG